MSKVYPFPAILPPAEKAAQVSSAPYDVMNRVEAKAMASDNPLCFLRVTRSEIEFPPETNPYSKEIYQKAKDNYQEIKKATPLVQNDTPAYYAYTQVMNGHRQTGIVATPAVDDYQNDIIKKHEKTRKAKEDDRTNHITTVGCQTGPVFLTYPDNETIDSIINNCTKTEPIFDITSDDGIQHIGWQIPAEHNETIQETFAKIPYLYIADGHHRAASAYRSREVRKKANPNHTGNEEYNRFLAVIFPASQLQCLPYNRVVKDLNGLSEEQLIEKIKENFSVKPADSANPTQSTEIRMYLQKKWWVLNYTGNIQKLSAQDSLDVSLLQNLILKPLLNIADPRTSERIDFIGGIRGTKTLEERVDNGSNAVSFSMYPTTVQQLMDIADASEIMPPKSTWFEPKLRDALFLHDI